MATPRTLAVRSSTHLEPPWLCRPEARGCVRVPYAHPPIAGGGLGVVMPPPTAPPSWVSEAVPRARRSLGCSRSSLPPSGWAARAISAKGFGTGAIG